MTPGAEISTLSSSSFAMSHFVPHRFDEPTLRAVIFTEITDLSPSFGWTTQGHSESFIGKPFQHCLRLCSLEQVFKRFFEFGLIPCSLYPHQSVAGKCPHPPATLQRWDCMSDFITFCHPFAALHHRGLSELQLSSCSPIPFPPWIWPDGYL